MTKQEGSNGSINFGRRADWIRLYAKRADCSQEYRNLRGRHEKLTHSLGKRQQDNIQQALGMLGTPMPPQQENFLADLDAFEEHLAGQVAIIS